MSLHERDPDLPEEAREILGAGRPAAGYTRDHMLVAVTPLPDGGRLSVGITPRTPHVDDARGAGDSYERWQWEILPAEVQARGLPNIENDLLRALHEELEEFTAASRETMAAATRLGERLREEAAAATRVGAEMDALEVSGPERTLLLAPLQSWVTMHGIVGEHVAELSELIDSLRQGGSRSRFHAALASLHATAADGVVAEGESAQQLIDVLRVDADDLAARAAERRRLGVRVSAKVRSVISLMGVPGDVIDGWLADTDFDSFPPGAHQLVAEVRSASENTAASISELEALADRLAGEPGPRPEELRARVESAAADLG